MNLKLLLAAAITTCIVTTATQAKADIYQTGKELISPSVIENFTVGIITSIVTAVIVWLWGKIRALQILNRKSAFFGISSKENCLVVMNHDSNPNHKNTILP